MQQGRCTPVSEPKPPPPEATLIRVARDATRMTLAAAALRASMSPQRWSQIENGYQRRAGGCKAVVGPPAAIAHMAYAVGVTPERLEEVRRPDAAEILREILRREIPPAAPVPPAPGPRTPLERIASDPDLSDDLKAAFTELARRLEAAERRRGNDDPEEAT